MNNTTFPQRLRAVRAARQKTLSEIAEAIGCSGQAISNWENGTHYPNSSKLVALCKFLDCSLDWIMDPEKMDFKTSLTLQTHSMRRKLMNE